MNELAVEVVMQRCEQEIAQLTKERDDLQIKFDERGVALDFWELACDRISKERDTLRKHIDSIVANPPPDVQEKVIQMLNLVHADAVKAVEKERDELQADLKRCSYELERVSKKCGAERSRAETAEAKRAEMREALDKIIPFAACYSSHPLRNPSDKLTKRLKASYHALSDQCGQGWLSPEQKKEMEEQHRMEMAAVMTATIQNTESTIKDRIPKENPYWTQAYGDVCTAIDREMKLIAQKKMLVGLIQRCDDYLAGAASFLPTRTEFKQALEACSQ